MNFIILMAHIIAQKIKWQNCETLVYITVENVDIYLLLLWSVQESLQIYSFPHCSRESKKWKESDI